MRRLVICADGTWNRPDDDADDGVDLSTNVLKMARTLRPVARGADGTEVSQIAYYHPGVGTGNLLDKAIGGALGRGIDRNIVECYRFLVHNYQPGDELYFFGFSRGAYTVRSLAGLIRNSGLVRLAFEGMIPEAYTLYRDRDPEKHPKAEAARLFRERFAHEVDIACIGVWDTVGALGIPVELFERVNRKYEFHDVTLSGRVRNAFHAVAIDERREPFAPTLWEQPREDEGRNWLEQAWFAGVHSDVGGGYPDDGLSDVALQWMIERVGDRTGLQFDAALIERACQPNVHGELHKSLKRFFKVLGEFERELDVRRKDPARRANTWEYVHASAYARHQEARRGPYAPPNLVRYLGTDPCFVAPAWSLPPKPFRAARLTA
jgi:uncharacterized protein (DUF2235 family)